MLGEFWDSFDKISRALYLGLLLLVSIGLLGGLAARQRAEMNAEYERVAGLVQQAMADRNKEVALADVLPLFEQTVMVGVWEKSLKRSTFLEE